MDLTIIIPSYNRENTIERAIESVLNQTVLLNEMYKYEIIVVDDCSQDDTVKKVNDMAIPNLKLIKLTANLGGNHARNIGVEASLGQYIAFQDSDDMWLPNKLEFQFKTLIEHKADIVFSSLISEDNNVQTIVPNGIEEGFAQLDDFLSFNKMSTQVMLGKKECFVANPFDVELKRFQDWELALRLVIRYKLYFIKEPLAIQYIQENSITRNNTKAFDSLLMIESKHRDLFKQNDIYYSKLFESIAFFATSIGINSDIYIRRSLKIKFSLKVFLKLLLNKIKIYQMFVNLRK